MSARSQKAAATYRRAAAIMAARGLSIGGPGPDNGPCCLIQALVHARIKASSDGPYMKEYAALYQVIGAIPPHRPLISDFSDRLTETAQAVEVLEAAAAIEEGSER